MTRILLVYYSRTGLTRLVAKEIARRCQCDVEEIGEAQPRDGKLGYARSLFDVLMKRHPAISTLAKDPGEYDLVVLGTPVWASDLSSPMRTYILENRDNFKRVAAFCTMGGSGGDKALEHLASLCRTSIVAEFVVTDREIETASYLAKVNAFTGELARAGVEGEAAPA